MNAKEEILKELQALRLSYNRERILYVNSKLGENSLQIILCDKSIERITSLIAATEQAIFDVPSEEEIRQAAQQIGLKAIAFPTAQALAFIDGCNFILNYKKP